MRQENKYLSSSQSDKLEIAASLKQLQFILK